MATIYTSDSLRNIFQSSFNLAQWYSFSQHFFNASELKEKPERIIENTSDEGYYLGNINTTDSYRIGLFHYNIRQGSVANKRVGLRNLVKSFINPTWGEFDAALVVFDSGDHCVCHSFVILRVKQHRLNDTPMFSAVMICYTEHLSSVLTF